MIYIYGIYIYIPYLFAVKANAIIAAEDSDVKLLKWLISEQVNLLIGFG
jgi:hypothetical protein